MLAIVIGFGFNKKKKKSANSRYYRISELRSNCQDLVKVSHCL